jgi:hypothetical protein
MRFAVEKCSRSGKSPDEIYKGLAVQAQVIEYNQVIDQGGYD